MDNISEQVFNLLPTDGSSLSGGQIKDHLKLSNKEFKAAKDELKERGYIGTGRGRGGTLWRLDPDVEYKPEEQPKKLSKAEVAEIAREAKKERASERKAVKQLIENAERIGKTQFPDCRVAFHAVSFSGDPIIEVWEPNSSVGKLYKVT